MPLDFVGQDWIGKLPGFFDLTTLVEIKEKTVTTPYKGELIPEKKLPAPDLIDMEEVAKMADTFKTVHQPELTTKADLVLKDLMAHGGLISPKAEEDFIAKLLKKPSILPGGASFPSAGMSKTKIVGKGPNVQQVPKKKGVIFDTPSGKEVFMGLDIAKEGSDKTAYVTINKTVSDIVQAPVPYDPTAPLEINWDALDPTVKKMVQEKEQEIMEKVANGNKIEKFDLQIGQPMVPGKHGFEPGAKPVTLHTTEMIAETHLPYHELDDIGTPWEGFPGGHAAWSKNNDDLLAKVEKHFGLTPAEQGAPKGVAVVNLEIAEDDHVGLVKAGLDLLMKAGIFIKSCDIHHEAKEISSATLELDVHDFGSSGALCLAMDMLQKKKPK